jgi:hypothetical protein
MEVAWLIVLGLLVVLGGLLLLAVIPRSDGNNSIDIES